MDAVIKPLRSSAATSSQPATPSDPSQPRPTREEAEAAVKTLISYVGDDPQREGLIATPRRVIEAFDELYQGTAPIRPTCSTAPSARPRAMTISS